MEEIRIQASEKAIESLLCEVAGEQLGLRIIGRQVTTPAGTIDLIAAPISAYFSRWNPVYYVIELKQGDIGPSALAQVLRYTRHMNAVKSKNGKRTFLPLLVGEHLRGDLQKVVTLFRGADEHDKSNFGGILYTLFCFNARAGVSFRYRNIAQYAYENEIGTETPMGHVLAELEHLDCEYYMLKRSLEDKEAQS
jgi:hypothetical protein